MVLNPILLGGVWFILHRYSVFHTFIKRGWVGGLSQMKLTSFEKNLSHFETIPKIYIIKHYGTLHCIDRGIRSTRRKPPT